MKNIRWIYSILVLVIGGFLLTGNAFSHGDEEGHGHEEPSSGATFKPDEGVIISDETQEILGLQVADVVAEKMPRVAHLNIQIFGETHRFPDMDMAHTGCDVHGSGFLAPEEASLIEAKQPVKISTNDGQSFDGFVLSTKENLTQGEVEVLIGIKEAGTKLKDGNFATAAIIIPREESVIAIPRSALLRTIEGTFVYVAKGDAFRRRPVKAGSESDEKIEIMEGLAAGEKVVATPVETLWIIELRATKGGGHSH